MRRTLLQKHGVFMKYLLLAFLASALAQAADKKPDQCVIFRDDLEKFELEVFQQTDILTSEGTRSFDVPKKILPAKFRQVQLPACRSYAANFIVRDTRDGQETKISVSAWKYVNDLATQEHTYYSADILPEIYAQKGEFGVSIAGNKFSADRAFGNFELHIAPCKGNEGFAPPSSKIVDSAEAPEDRSPPVYH